jgi:hypothetical protein
MAALLQTIGKGSSWTRLSDARHTILSNQDAQNSVDFWKMPEQEDDAHRKPEHARAPPQPQIARITPALSASRGFDLNFKFGNGC